jgi:hypothetical protein
MRLAAAIVVFFGAYFAAVLLVRRRSSVIRELDRRYFVRQLGQDAGRRASDVLDRARDRVRDHGRVLGGDDECRFVDFGTPAALGEDGTVEQISQWVIA